MNDPHEQKRVARDHYYLKTEVRCRLVAILDWMVEDRGLTLTPHLSRTVRRGDMLELITTDEEASGPGATVHRAAYLGFVEVTEGGLILGGDRVTIDRKTFGEVAGFDETHAPNHLNIVIRVATRQTGRAADLKLDGLVTFAAIEPEGEKRIGFYRP